MLVIIICVVIAILVWWFAFGHPVSRLVHIAARSLIINVSFREQVEIQVARPYYVYLFNKTYFTTSDVPSIFVYLSARGVVCSVLYIWIAIAVK